MAVRHRGYDTTFYSKILVAGGIPVISSSRVEDRAIELAAEIVDSLLAFRPDVREAMIGTHAYVGVMDDTEVTTDVPEHRYLRFDPDIDWDARARGLGGHPGNPITTVGEENLLCMEGDRYAGQSILAHEFGHAIHLLGINFVESGFQTELESLYRQAISDGLWAGSYAATDEREYWAVGVQAWFDAAKETVEVEGASRRVTTRADLEEHDPRLHALLGRYFRDGRWSALCVARPGASPRAPVAA